jgi:hypothetical protein
VVAFPASPEASCLNGVEVPVDGGTTAYDPSLAAVTKTRSALL